MLIENSQKKEWIALYAHSSFGNLLYCGFFDLVPVYTGFTKIK